MVKSGVLLLAVSILLTLLPQSGFGRQEEPPAETRAAPIHRIILLTTPSPLATDPVVRELYHRSQVERVERERKRRLPAAKQDNHPAFVLPGALVGKPPPDPAKSVSDPQLIALADLYLLDALTDRMTSRYRITVVEAAEVKSAQLALDLTPGEAETPQGAAKLCTRLGCDAVLHLGAPRIIRQQGAERDLVIRVEIGLAALRDPHGGFVPVKKPRPSSSSTTIRGAIANFTVTGYAEAGRSFLRGGFSSEYPTLAHQAAQQAAALALHTLSTGEVAPLMDTAKIAVAPAFGPESADVLIFAPEGRRTESGAIRLLPQDVSQYFRPLLLPVLNNEVIDAVHVGAAMKGQHPPTLWRDTHTPDTDAIRRLGRSVGASYMLVSRLSDVEAASAQSDSEPARPAEGTEPAAFGSSRWQRQARAEATGALVRISDGVILWSDRGETTITSREKVTADKRADADRSITIQAEKFALIDLKRKFAAYRSGFEQ